MTDPIAAAHQAMDEQARLAEILLGLRARLIAGGMHECAADQIVVTQHTLMVAIAIRQARG